ncbi:hypothetical protein Esti_001753 [Eimeria stiedai]
MLLPPPLLQSLLRTQLVPSAGSFRASEVYLTPGEAKARGASGSGRRGPPSSHYTKPPQGGKGRGRRRDKGRLLLSALFAGCCGGSNDLAAAAAAAALSTVVGELRFCLVEANFVFQTCAELRVEETLGGPPPSLSPESLPEAVIGLQVACEAGPPEGSKSLQLATPFTRNVRGDTMEWAPHISEEEWLLQSVAAATGDGGLRASPGVSHVIKASTPPLPPAAAAAATLCLPSIAQGGSSGAWAGFNSFSSGASLKSGLATLCEGPLGAPAGLVDLSRGRAQGDLGRKKKVNDLAVGPVGALAGGSVRKGGLLAQSLRAPSAAVKASGSVWAPLEGPLGASLTGSLVGSSLGLSVDAFLRGGPLGIALAPHGAASPCAATHQTGEQQSSGWAPQQKAHMEAALASSSGAVAPLASQVFQEGRCDPQQRKTASRQLGLEGLNEAPIGDALSSSGHARGDTEAPNPTEGPPPDLVEPLPRSFLHNLGLEESLSSEETGAYEASVRSNCLLWLPLERRPGLLVPGLVLYTYLQNLSVSSKLIFCLAPSARQAIELQRALQKALVMISPPEGHYEGPFSEGHQGLIVRLSASRDGRHTAAARIVESYWSQKKLRVRWGAPSTWQQYREALKEYSEAVRELEGLGNAVPTTETEKQRHNLQRLLAPFRFALSQLEALKAASRMSERPPTPPARAPHQEPLEGSLDREAGCAAPNEWDEMIPEEALLQWPRVFVATPSVFTTLLMHGFIRLEELALLVLDCPCRSSSSSGSAQPYERLLVDFFSRAASLPRILGLIRGPVGDPPGLPSDLKSLLRRLHCSAFLLAEPLGPAGGPPDLRICRYTPEPVVYTAKSWGLREHSADAVGGVRKCPLSKGPSRHCFLEAVSMCLSVCDRWLDAAVQGAHERTPLHDPLSALPRGSKETSANEPFTADFFKAARNGDPSSEDYSEDLGGLGFQGLPLGPYRDCLLDAAVSGVEGHPLVRANSLCMHGVVALQAALPPWLSWPFGEALRIEGSSAYLQLETESSMGSCGAFMRPDPLLLQRRLHVGLGFVLLELLGAFVRRRVPSDFCVTFQNGLQGLTTSLHGLSLQNQKQQQQRLQRASHCDGMPRGALQSLFSPRLLELDRVLCRLLAQDQTGSWGEDPQKLPSLESLQREGGVLVLCSSNAAAWCLTSFLKARALGQVVHGLGSACKGDSHGACSFFTPRHCVSLEHTSLGGQGYSVCRNRAVDRISPLHLTVSSCAREALSESSPAGFGLVIMTETPETEGDLLRAVAACRKPTSRAARASAGPSVLLLLAPDDCPEDSYSSLPAQCRWTTSRRSSRRFGLYDLLRRVQQLRRCAGGEASLLGGEGDGQASDSPAVSLQQQKGGVVVSTTGAFVPPSLAWSFLQQVLTEAYGEAACEAYRAARGPSASACFTLGPLRARKEYSGAPRLEIPPLQGFRQEPLLPQVLEALDFPVPSQGPHEAVGMGRPCGSWREPWERLAVQALQRLHAAGVLNDNLLLKPVPPVDAEADEAISDKTVAKRDSGVYSLEASWRLLPQGLLAPEALNRLLLEGESTECCIQLYVHRVWCTPVTWQQVQQEQQWQQQEQQREAAAPHRAAGKPRSSSKADVPMPCSPLYESGGLLGYWSLFSSKRKPPDTEAAAAAADAEATKAAAIELLTKLFPHKPISSVLQPLALLLPSALPEPVVFYGVHPMGSWRGPLFPGAEGAREGPPEPSDCEDEDGGPLENSSTEADSEGQEPETLPGEEGLMRIDIDPPDGEEMILRIPSAAALKALLVFTHDMLLRDVAVSSFRPFVGRPSEVDPLWGALFAAASRGPPPPSSCGAQVGGPQQHSSATLRLYAANDEAALAYLDGIYLQQDEAAAAATARATSSISSERGSSTDTKETPPSTDAAGLRKESVLQLLMKAGVRDLRRILLPLFAVAPLAWDGKSLDLAYLCTQRLLACFAASSKWHAHDVSRSLMEAHGEEALRESVKSLGFAVSASKLIASALRRLTDSEASSSSSSSTLAAAGDSRSRPNTKADEDGAAERQIAEAHAEELVESLLFSAGSPLAHVGTSFPLKEFCMAGGMGVGRGPLAPMTGAESLHPQKGLYVFRALAARGLERPVLRLTHDEKRSYRYVALRAVDTQNTPWGSGGPTKAGGPLLSDAYRRELSHAGVHLLEPHPDPLKGPHGNCWLLRGPRIRQGCRALFRNDKGGGAPNADPDAAYAPQFARLCPWTEPVFHQLTWLAPAFYRLEAAASQWELRSFVLEETQLTSADGSRRRQVLLLLSHASKTLKGGALLQVAARQLDSRLLSAALTTPAARQPGDVDSGGSWWHSQRLEFLGDAVLEFSVSLCLFLCRQEGDTEGVLTEKRSQFVSNAHLSASAKKAGFSNHILARPFSPLATLLDLRRQSLSRKMQADAMEALIASIYLSNSSFLATHNHSSSGSSSTTEPRQGQQGGAAWTGLHLRGPLVTQEAPRSFGGLVAASSFIDRFILRSRRGMGAPADDGSPALGPFDMLPPAVTVLTAAAAVCRRCCSSSADETTSAVERELSVLEGPSGGPPPPAASLEAAEVSCILRPLGVTGETSEPRLDSCAQVRPLLQQLAGLLEGHIHTKAVSVKPEGETQTGCAAPPPTPHANWKGFLLDRRLPQWKTSHAAVSDMWLACARRASSGCLLAVEEPESHEVRLPRERQLRSRRRERSFWSGRHLNLRLVALARTVQAEPGTLRAPLQLGPPESYELLEFVGDSLLRYLVTEWLFCLFPAAREGALTMAKSILLSNGFFAAKLIRRMHAAGMSLDSLPLGDPVGPDPSVPCACEILVVGNTKGGDSWGSEVGRSLLSVLWKQAAAAGCEASRPCCCCCCRCTKRKRDRVEELLLALPPEQDFAREAEDTLSHRTTGAGLLRAADTPDSDGSSSSSSPKWIKQLGDIYESLACVTFFSSGCSPQATWEAVAEDFESCRPQLAAFLAAAQRKGQNPKQQGPLLLDI